MSASEVAVSPTSRGDEFRRRGMSTLLAASGCVLLCLLVHALCGLLPDSLEQDVPQPMAAPVRKLVNVSDWRELRVAAASEPGERLSDPMPARVVVDERTAARVGSPLAGRVTQVLVQLGQTVRRGDPLFRVSSPQLPGYRAEVARAELGVTTARLEDERVQSMARSQLVPGKEALASASQLRHAELARDAAQSRLSALRVKSSSEHEFTVIAQQDGVIVEKRVLPSQNVTPADSLLQIADLARGVWVMADVFESDVAGISVGGEARIQWMTGTEHERLIDARVEDVSAVVDPWRHSVRVRMHVTDKTLRPNQYAEVRFRHAPPAQAAEVAASALVADGVSQALYVADDAGGFERRTVLVGGVREQRALVIAGLSVGE
ncbi:MAG: efflux RND transporter periplasmic adaptor subunit, partial [Polyangiales bacterium]